MTRGSTPGALGHPQFGLPDSEARLLFGVRVFVKVTEGDSPRMFMWRICGTRHCRGLRVLVLRVMQWLAGRGYACTLVGLTGDERQGEVIGQLARAPKLRKRGQRQWSR